MKNRSQSAAFAGLLILAVAMPAAAFGGEAVSFSIHFVDGQTRFHVGEAVPIELEFSALLPNGYDISTADYDRSGRLNLEQFHVTPAGRDPLHNYYAEGGFFGGGLSSSHILGVQPDTRREELNEWVALDQPGHYTVYLTSGRVSRREATRNQSVVLKSNSLEFEVLLADANWQAQQLNAARFVLDDAGSSPEQTVAALRSLRFLDTLASVEELVRQLGKQAESNWWDCMAGLAGSLHQDFVVQALTREMRESDVAITQQYLFLLTKLKFQLDRGMPPVYPEHGETSQQEVWREKMKARNDEMTQLGDALYQQAADLVSVKQGTARAETIRTLLLHTTNKVPIPAQQVVAAFNALSADEQYTLLSTFWERLKLNAMIPALQRLAAQPVIQHQLLRDTAIARLYELDPQAGRTRILEEIAHPHTDDGAFSLKGKALGVLPDETLPQFDDLLAGRLATKDSRTLDLDAQLIGRYATDRILTQVKAFYERSPNRWDCLTEDGLTLYFLRVQPDYGVRRLATTPSFCMTNSLAAVIRMNRWSDVEPSIIAALNQTDLNRARQAAETLARYGGAKAKAAMWVRLRSFHQQWADRESKLFYRAGMPSDENDAMGFQFGLVESLGRARAWLLNEEEVTELEKLTLAQERENVKQWHRKSPVQIAVNALADGHVGASIERYEVQDVEALKTKLSQYEGGTRFSLSSFGSEEQLRAALRAVRDVAAEHGLIVENARQESYNCQPGHSCSERQ